MKYPLVFFSLLASASAQGSAALSKCAFVNVVFDESGSMSEAHNVLVDAIHRIADNILGDEGYQEFVVCTSGFGFATSGVHGYRQIGCSPYGANTASASPRYLPNDPTIYNFETTGSNEDGYYAINQAIIDRAPVLSQAPLASCDATENIMIFASDEDRDALATDLDRADITTALVANNYTLNTVTSINIYDHLENPAGFPDIFSNRDNLGMHIDPSGVINTIFQPLPGGGYSSTVYGGNYRYHTTGQVGTTHEDYTELVPPTNGIAWNIDRIVNATTAQVFADAFVDRKILEITCPSGRCESGSGSNGDPHVKTWKNEHFEYHGQCDLVLVKDQHFMEGRGLDIHMRTKIVRYWSYIQAVVVRIGNDILEVQGSADPEDDGAHFWINYEFQGDLEEFAGFPVTQLHPYENKRSYFIDLNNKFPGQGIEIYVYKEFVGVKFAGTQTAFANSVGLLGDFHTGETLARDGSTVMQNFEQFGNEWQVLPADGHYFHEVSRPQFPEECIIPEDPQGQRTRRLTESSISIEEAEKACAGLKDPLDRKDCVYDIIATQDMGMTGAF